MTQRKLFAILGPNNKRYSPAFQTEADYADARAKLLERWRNADLIVHCLCRSAQPVPLVLRKYASGKTALARHPDTGPMHDGACQYFGPSVKGAIARAYESGVVVEDGGVYKVRLAAGRQMTDPLPTDELVEPRPRYGPGVPGQPAMTTLGLLKLLWEIAALHEYRPAWKEARAKPGAVPWRLHVAARDVQWGSAKLSNSLQVGPVPADDRLAKRNLAVAKAATDRRTRVVVISRLQSYDCAQTPAIDLAPDLLVPLAGSACIRPYLSKEHAQGLQRSFARELAAWRAGEPTYAVLIVQPKSEGKYFELVRIALMRVSPQAIPLDSGYEATVEDALVKQRRAFDKPMRHIDGDDTLPDFRLLDMGHWPMPMEVFGLTDPAYQARIREKETIYAQGPNPPGWWRWDAFANVPMPDLPERPVQTGPTES